MTVSPGSTLATIALSLDATLSEGVLALALLIGLQFEITWYSIRVSWLRSFVTGELALLLYRGQFPGDVPSKANCLDARTDTCLGLDRMKKKGLPANRKSSMNAPSASPA